MATAESLNHTETIDNKRYYNIVDKEGKSYKFPSVTTIIGAMSDKSGLENWRKRVGDAEADRISRFSANRGTCMHQKLEYWFTSNIEDKKERLISVNEQMNEFVKENGYTQEELKCGNGLFNSLYVCGFFNKVQEIVEMEETLWSATAGGYAGRVDCIYKDKDGKLVLLDFKTARHKKRDEWLSGYYLQLSAYYLAYAEMYGIKLDRAELWIAVENDAPQLVEISQSELRTWLNHFLRMVKAYHENFDYLLEETVIDSQNENIKKIGNIVVRHFAVQARDKTLGIKLENELNSSNSSQPTIDGHNDN